MATWEIIFIAVLAAILILLVIGAFFYASFYFTV